MVEVSINQSEASSRSPSMSSMSKTSRVKLSTKFKDKADTLAGSITYRAMPNRTRSIKRMLGMISTNGDRECSHPSSKLTLILNAKESISRLSFVILNLVAISAESTYWLRYSITAVELIVPCQHLP